MPDTTYYRAGTPDDGHMNVQILKERGGKDGDLFAGVHNPLVYPPT